MKNSLNSCTKHEALVWAHILPSKANKHGLGEIDQWSQEVATCKLSHEECIVRKYFDIYLIVSLITALKVSW